MSDEAIFFLALTPVALLAAAAVLWFEVLRQGPRY